MHYDEGSDKGDEGRGSRRRRVSSPGMFSFSFFKTLLIFFLQCIYSVVCTTMKDPTREMSAGAQYADAS